MCYGGAGILVAIMWPHNIVTYISMITNQNVLTITRENQKTLKFVILRPIVFMF